MRMRRGTVYEPGPGTVAKVHPGIASMKSGPARERAGLVAVAVDHPPPSGVGEDARHLREDREPYHLGDGEPDVLEEVDGE